MFIDINKIDEDGLSFDRTLDLGDLDGGAGRTIPVRATRILGRVTRVGEAADLEGRWDATVVLSCARCLEGFEVAMAGDLELHLVRDEPVAGPRRDDDDPADETLFHAPEGRADLGEIVTEQIYLSLPMKPVCRQDCKGLCPECGVNRNVDECGCSRDDPDPRLAPLREWKQRLSDR
jgi:uncharacterized protein